MLPKPWKIRNRVFETNSSSTHSICISNKPQDEDYFVHDRLVIYTGKFGWEIEKHFDFATKASYLLTYVHHYGSPRDEELLKSIIEEYTNKEVLFQTDDDDYIDHQSAKVAGDLFTNENCRYLIEQFLFCSSSFLQTSNDNQ